jgi:predicted transcriptional regulator
MSKRTNYRTIKIILTAINKGESKPNRISFKSNVSYDRLLNCLSHLEKIECVESRQHTVSSNRVMKEYFITIKGEYLLMNLQKVENIIDK